MKKKRILILEDDTVLADGLSMNLEMAEFDCVIAHNIKEAMQLLKRHQCHLLLLDINLPDGEGISFARTWKKKIQVPVIFLTARDMDADMMRGFEAGADDYVTKPFNIRILIQRIQAVLRRYEDPKEESKDDPLVSVGNLTIDFERCIVHRQGAVLMLTRTEYRLLEKFCMNPGMVLTREILLDALWDQEGNYVDEHTLTIFVSRLRGKIADEEFTYIKTVYGMGYRWIGGAHE